MKDLLYYYDKTTYAKHELGEIQTGFNMSFVLDGTKDSATMQVISFNEQELTPNTIVFHRGTQTWWIISHDKVERYEYENSPLYTHNLQLEGAIELLNARDLTDSGFNANRYGVDDFIKRLFALSNFDFNKTSWNTSSNYNLTIDYQSNIASSKTVDYIKTFENYTLLSALREFLDGYNCAGRLEFTETSNVLTGAKLIIVSKTGNTNVQAVDGEWLFTDPRETKNMDKNSYGTSVISNAENVVSTKSKTYPSVGGVRLSSNNGMAVTKDNAVLRLPSNIFKVNYIDIFWNKVPYGYVSWSGNTATVHYIGYFDSSKPDAVLSAYNTFITTLTQQSIDTSSVSVDWFKQYAARIYYCDNYDAVNNVFKSDNSFETINTDDQTSIPIVLSTQELKSSVLYPERVIAYDRGKDYISGFDAFCRGSNGKSIEITSLTTHTIYKLIGTNNRLVAFVGAISVNGNAISSTYPSIDIKDASFSVNYIPMGDLKIKYDNDGDTIDSSLYNQNGRLNDSNALSKVLLSHSKEIESDTITRYGTFYGNYVDTIGFQKGNLPSVGDLIYINNDYYVVNNISIDFNPNESSSWLVDSFGYYMTVEVSMSKKVATKSLLTSPNTNIRDYGIPQNNNVKRKQLYRDFYEFTYEADDNADNNWYMPLTKVLNLSNEVQDYQEHIAVINMEFENEVNGGTNYYYQLETTTYFLKKAIYEVVDFKDNNIIGYGYQNLWSGFDITKILSGISSLIDLYTIPISYVDDNGEAKAISVALTTVENLTTAYDNYLQTTQYSGSKVSIYNASVFIPSDIYDDIVNNIGQDILITESNYRKDALEVPVFEYSCQVDDTNDILVGENILDRGNNDVAYMYSYTFTSNSVLYNDNNFENLNLPLITVSAQNEAYNVRAVSMDMHDNYVLIKLYDSVVYDIDNGTATYGNEVDLSNIVLTDTSLVIARHNLTEDDVFVNLVGILAFNSLQSALPTASSTYKNKYVILDDGTYAVCEPDEYNFSITNSTNVATTYIIYRDGVQILAGTVPASNSLSTEVLQDDVYSYTATASSGYYFASNKSSTIHYDNQIVNGDVSLSFSVLPYVSVAINVGNGVDYVALSLSNLNNGAIMQYDSSRTFNNRFQDERYDYAVYAQTGWNLTGDTNANGTVGSGLTINATAERLTYTLTFTTSGTGTGYLIVDYIDPDTDVSSQVNMDNGDTLTLKYGTSYSWRAVANSGSYRISTEYGSGVMPVGGVSVASVFAINPVITANISGTGAGTISLYYKAPNYSSWTNVSLSNGGTQSIQYNSAYYWVANASSGSYVSGTTGGGTSASPLTLTQNTTLSTSFTAYYSITWNAGSNSTIRVVVSRSGTTIYDSGSGQSTATYSQLKDGDSVSITMSANTGYYFASNGGTTKTYSYSVVGSETYTGESAIRGAKITKATIGGYYQVPSSGVWYSTATLYPNFELEYDVDVNNIQSIVITMTITNKTSGVVVATHTKTYSSGFQQIASNVISMAAGSSYSYSPLINFDSSTLSYNTGAHVSSALDVSASSCEIEMTITYVGNKSFTSTIGGVSLYGGVYKQNTSSNRAYLGFYNSSLEYYANGNGNSNFTDNNSCARWYDAE